MDKDRKVISIDEGQQVINRKKQRRKELINQRMVHIMAAREYRLEIESIEQELLEYNKVLKKRQEKKEEDLDEDCAHQRHPREPYQLH